MNKRYWCALVMVVVALDLLGTYWQNAQLPLDGDLVPIVFPAQWYSQVLHDPFGWAVLTENATYAGTNRFFAHAIMGLYWKQVPRLLQHFTTPVNSLYAASALFNTGVQALVLFALAAYVRLGGGAERSPWSYWLAAALLFPLFQTSGFYEQMGITNQAITYTFFYGFPLALLLLLLWPFFQAARHNQPLRLPSWRLGCLVLLMVVIAFNGPICIAAVAVLLLGIGAYWAWHRWRGLPGAGMPWLGGQTLPLLALLSILSIYSLFIGRNNAENSHTHTLGQLYQLLPTGLYLELKMHWGLPLLLLAVLANAQLVRRLAPATPGRQRVLNSLRWVALFALVFVLLLPFGGYRPYRPYLVRGDSILPVLLGLFYAYGVSTYFLLHQLRGRVKTGYGAALASLLLVFAYADSTTKMQYNNDCQRWALDQIAHSAEPVVRVAPTCTVLSWDILTDYHQTELQANMLHYWGVTTSPKPYYQ
ncbi:MAG: hypothetical protein M3Y12_11905 [Bacteroidota bacterium]|nr:hypothetical protein [Bacteroidota bacterium]